MSEYPTSERERMVTKVVSKWEEDRVYRHQIKTADILGYSEWEDSNWMFFTDVQEIEATRTKFIHSNNLRIKLNLNL